MREKAQFSLTKAFKINVEKLKPIKIPTLSRNKIFTISNYLP
jgi:hypothetical protein